jgi:hypothetical protein
MVLNHLIKITLETEDTALYSQKYNQSYLLHMQIPDLNGTIHLPSPTLQDISNTQSSKTHLYCSTCMSFVQGYNKTIVHWKPSLKCPRNRDQSFTKW